MPTDVLITLLALLAGVVLIGAPAAFKYRIRHSEAVSHHLEQIGRDGCALIEDPSVPELVADLVYRSMAHARNPSLARHLVRTILDGSFFRDAKQNQVTPSPLMRGLDELTPAQRLHFGRYTANLMLCSASSDLAFAVITRRIVIWGLMNRTADDVYDSPKASALAAEAAASMGFAPAESRLALAQAS